LSGGIALLVAVSIGIALQFAKLYRQVQLNRMYDNFIANVSHELKTPLASLQLHLDTLKQRHVSPAHLERFVSLMSSDSNRLNEQIDSIMEVARLEDRRFAIELVRSDADKLLRSIVEESTDRYAARALRIEVRGESNSLISADRGTLKIAVDNLIDNAVKYSPDEPNIEIDIERLGRFVRFSCTDGGVGLSHRDKNRVFRKFHRVDDPMSPSVKGVGLGLYRVREIIRHHKGRVSVTSLGSGMGSTFRIDLPRISK
jgi:signal transduction histidine kinase